MKNISFKHWKTGKILNRTGEIVLYNQQSDRLILKLEDGTFEDIIKNTIVKIEECDEQKD